ncbi:carboxypeptidase-like regulatory domain-containing protein [Myroides guanonis]|uniref:CarboxypepD_reg-like domain-containing protein n=1 Tax=Myroides guanonis TaxID=1150112 RepID=A0A1I3Q5S0_9FLAO|nr:carboxypeptidase-like regulatory domain-containing protein [Myroides guanonis]SFJ29333.1 hypothetical protein SAMN04487893_10576 [Myroides guanonis]
MIKLFISALLLLLSSLGYTQNSITGTMKNSSDNTIHAYVSIGVVDKVMGTVSKEDGSFSMKINQSLKGTDIINSSLIGYQDYSISLNEFEASNKVFYLTPKSDVLPEISIIKKTINQYTIGSTEYGKMLFKFYHEYDSSKDDLLGREQAIIFDIENDIIIDKISFHIGCNEYQNIKLRLKLYDIVNGEPTTTFNQEDIIFEVSEGNKGLFTIDLQNYSIAVKDKKQIGVGLEWIEGLVEGEKPKCFGITYNTSKKKNHLFRPKSEATWQYLRQNMALQLDVTEIEIE